MEKRAASFTVGRNWCSHYGEHYGVSSTKQTNKTEPLHNLVITLLGICSKKMKALTPNIYIYTHPMVLSA